MTSVARTLSPGGSLLRASRMFSLPSALPSPPDDHQAATTNHSDTATAAFPTLQTVTVPEAFRQRGDWGFKRNFPLRSTTKTSTPFLRVKQVDSLEHVTDYSSAADHTLTLEKWQEMNLAISLPHPINDTTKSGLDKTNSFQSVFEDKNDFTAIDSQDIKQAGQIRWKYKGPWLANLSEGEFQKYLRNQVRNRRSEFRAFLRKTLAPWLTEAARQRALDAGDNTEVPEIRPEHVTDEQVLIHLRTLRVQRERLYEAIGEFLDLVPIQPPAGKDYYRTMYPGQKREVRSENPYSKHGPPITHPSAGLSYLRTNAYMDNHPVYGPQRAHASVKARILGAEGQYAKIGVGGFVSPSKIAYTQFERTGQSKVDFDTPGGSRIWVHPISAQIDAQGKALVHVSEAQEEKLIVQEMRGETQLYRAKALFSDAEDSLELEFESPRSSKQLNKRNSTVKNSDRRTYGAEWDFP